MTKAKVKFVRIDFCMGKSQNLYFSETIAACGLKIGRCSELNE